MLSNALNLAISAILVNAMAEKVSDTYMEFAHLASNSLIAAIASTI